jgi:L-serine dehydratase
MYKSLADAIRDAEASGRTLSQTALALESKDQGRSIEDIRSALRRALVVMRSAVERGLEGDLRSAMGVIVAAPTAGGAGVLPAVLTGLARDRKIPDEQVIDALATAGLIGAVVADRASLSGAEGGCQAETGAAAGMAAGAATEMLGGTPTQVGHAVSLTMQGTLGLVCDPLVGLVELPCVFRNATGAALALAGIEMALSGIQFAIPVDEVIDVMGEIGRNMDVRYRETAGGGLAATPTGRRLAKERLVQIRTARRSRSMGPATSRSSRECGSCIRGANSMPTWSCITRRRWCSCD